MVASPAEGQAGRLDQSGVAVIDLGQTRIAVAQIS